MKRGEGNAKVYGALLPFTLLGEEAVSEFAERAMVAPESSADPIRHFTEESRIRVVDANELNDVRSHRYTVPTVFR
jgi:hypothetical protein